MAAGNQTIAPEINRFFTSYASQGVAWGFSARYKEKPGHLLHLTLGGQATFCSGSVEKTVSSGDIVLIDPQIPHDYQVGDPTLLWRVICIHFFARSGWHSLLEWPELAPGFRYLRLDDPTDFWRVIRRLISCHRLAQGPWRHRQALAEAELESALTWCAELGPHRRPLIDSRLERAIQFLHRHLADPLTQSQIAEHIAWSPTHLRACFRQAVGCTPLQYLDRLRMERAVELLHLSDAPVYEIASEVGYDDPAYFSRRFRRIAGQSPQQCRNVTR